MVAFGVSGALVVGAGVAAIVGVARWQGDAVDCSVRAADDFASAAAIAGECATDVEVLSERTPWESSWARAEGGARLEVSAVPTRVEVDGAWHPLDGAIMGDPGADPLRVAAPVYPISLNPGGPAGRGEPLGSIERHGRTLEVWFPLELPEPTIGDAQVSYRLGAGIRLFVSVNADGSGFLPVVELADAAAAAEFARMLSEARGVPSEAGAFSIGFDTAVSEGLSPRLDEGDAVRFVDEAGDTHFMAQPPIMWDSSAVEPPVRASATEVGVTDRTRSPAGGDRIAEMGVELVGDAIVIEPNAELLSSADTVWPVYIDPGYNGVTPHEWVAVRTGGYTSTLYKWGDLSSSKLGQGTGYCSQVSSCNTSFKQRLAWEFAGLSALPPIPSGDISSATFSVYGSHSYNCTARTATLHRTSDIGTGSNWGNVAWYGAESSRTEAHSVSCGNVGFKSFNVLNAVRYSADHDQTQITLGMLVDESSMVHWKRFRANASLSIEWNRAPRVPSGHQLAPSSAAGCITGESRPVTADTTPDVSAVASDPDGQNVAMSFEVASAANKADIRWSSGNLPAQAGGTRATRTVGSGLLDGGVYAWRARAFDGGKYSAWSAWCEFRVDISPPAAPSVTPQAAGALAVYAQDATRGGVGLTGSFTIDGSAATDAIRFAYGFDDPTMSATVLPGSGGTAVVSFTPAAPGPVVLQVRSFDAAGNFSSTTEYAFTVASATEDGIWMLDEGEGAVAADSAGSGDRPLTIGGAQWTEGPHAMFDAREGDTALHFDGVDDAAQSDGPVVDTADSFAISAHVWLDAAGQGTTRTVLSQDGVGGSGFRVEYRASCPELPGGCWAFTMPDAVDGSAATAVYSAVAPRADEWTHLVAEFDALDDSIGLWVCEVGTPTSPRHSVEREARAGRAAAPWPAAGSFALGRGLSAGQPDGWWSGRIDNVRVFEGEVLAPEKIRRLCQGAEASDFGGDDTHLDPTEDEQ